MAARTTFTIDDELLERARRLDINVSAAARQGVEAAVRQALTALDRAAYLMFPEGEDDGSWEAVEVWGEG